MLDTRSLYEDVFNKTATASNPHDPNDTNESDFRRSIARVIATGWPDTLPGQRYPIPRALSSGEVYLEERFWDAVNTPIFAKDAALTCIVRSITEVTELHEARKTLHKEAIDHEQAEERLRQSEKLKAIGQMTGGIAHEFNNMLQGITTSLALVRARLAQGRFADAQAYIEPAQKAATRAGALTHRLLAFSRQQTLAPVQVSMDQVAIDMEEMIGRTVGSTVQLELNLRDGHWLVMCDLNQLESALLNLCVNARDAMPDGGWLTIITDERILEADDVKHFEDLQPGRYAAMAVSDTGSGIPPKILARIFEPFFTTKPSGQGLGLSQIYGFIRQSGGLIQVETSVGAGTTIRICLPFHAMNQKHPQPLLINGKTLILVEDEEVIRGLLADQLRDLGYRVLEAETASSAMRLLNTGVNVDLLITDVGLRGGANGRQH